MGTCKICGGPTKDTRIKDMYGEIHKPITCGKVECIDQARKRKLYNITYKSR